jgi:hypothetical protein
MKAFMFERVSNKLKKVVCDTFQGLNIQLFTYVIHENLIEIHNVFQEEIVYEYQVNL